MKDKFQDKYRIEPNRWQFWDYSAPGSYFITICTDGRKWIFGHVEHKTMILSEYGEIVESEFLKMAGYHKRAFLDVWVIMPNHVHCIISLSEYGTPANGTVEKIHEFSHSKQGERDFSVHKQKIHEFSHSKQGECEFSVHKQKIHEFSHSKQGERDFSVHKQKIREFSLRNHKPTESEIIQYRKNRRKMLIPKILGKFQMLSSKKINILRGTPGVKNWQPDYYDHVIRDEMEYLRINDYIINNPANWDKDTFYTQDK